jgi:2-phospho-L-lactate transferase/gluconeogenesis factor (CofD/UPF0052 family)
MTKFGETNDFSAKDFVNEIESHLGNDVLDYVLLNNKIPSGKTFLKYRKEKAKMVRYERQDFEGKNFKVIEANFLRKKDFIRHDPKKVAKVIYSIK